MVFEFRKKYFLIIFFLMAGVMTSHVADAQDAARTMFWADPMYLNPAFTGTAPQYRLSSIYRHRQLSISDSYEHFRFAADYNIDAAYSGVGLAFTHDDQGPGRLLHQSAHLTYSYKLPVTAESALSMSLEGAFVSRRISNGDLLFEDELLSGEPTTEVLENAGRNYADISAGMLYYEKRGWLGLSAHHLNNPDVSFTGAETDNLPLRLSVHGGLHFNWDDMASMSPALIFINQGDVSTVQVGSNFTGGAFHYGAWYRTTFGLFGSNNDDLSINAGIEFKGLFAGVSYGFDLSPLQRSGGNLEVSLRWMPFKDNKSRHSYRYVNCPIE